MACRESIGRGLGALGALVLVGCTAAGPDDVVTTPEASSAASSTGPAATPEEPVPPVLDLVGGTFPDAIDAGIVSVLLDDAPNGRLQPDGSLLVWAVRDEPPGARFGRLDPDQGSRTWLTEWFDDGVDDSWAFPVGASGDWVVWERAWSEKGIHDHDLGLVYAHDAASGTTIDLTQSEPTGERRTLGAVVVGNSVYWSEEGGPLHSRELTAGAQIVIHPFKAMHFEENPCAAALGETEVVVSAADETGDDVELLLTRRGIQALPVVRGLPWERPHGLACGDAEAVVVAEEDPEIPEVLELVEPTGVTRFEADGSSSISVDSLTPRWLTFRLVDGAEGNGLQFLYDRAGAVLYRLPSIPSSSNPVSVVGDLLSFGVGDLDDPLGESRRFVLARLTGG